MSLQGSSPPRVMRTARGASPLPTDTDRSAAASPSSSNGTAAPAQTQSAPQPRRRASQRLLRSSHENKNNSNNSTTASHAHTGSTPASLAYYDEQQVYNVAMVSSPMRVGEVERAMCRLFRMCGATAHTSTAKKQCNNEKKQAAGSKKSSTPQPGNNAQQEADAEAEEEDSLAVAEWEDMLHSFRFTRPHLKLPPQPILDTLTRAIHAAAALPSNAQTHTMSFLDFITFLESELELLQGDLVAGCHLRPSAMPPPFLPPHRPPPCWTAFLAAVAPRELQILTGPAMVYYLRSIGAVHAMLAGLLIHLETTAAQRQSSGEAAAGAEQRHNIGGCGESGDGNDSTALRPRLRWKDEVTRADEADAAEGGSTTTTTTSDTAQDSTLVHGTRHRVLPRYMQPRRLDELSRSIIARARARRLIEQLRRRAIPVNRLECFAKLETEETPELAIQLLLESCQPAGQQQQQQLLPPSHHRHPTLHNNNTERDEDGGSCVSEDSDDLFVGRHGLMRNGTLAAGALKAHGVLHYGYVPRLIPRPDSSRRVMFRMNGVANAVPAAVQRATFERLSKPQCDPRWFGRTPPRHAASPHGAAPKAVSPWPIRTDTTSDALSHQQQQEEDDDNDGNIKKEDKSKAETGSAEVGRRLDVPQRASSALADTHSIMRTGRKRLHDAAAASNGCSTPSLPQLLLTPYASPLKPHAPSKPRPRRAVRTNGGATQQPTSDKAHDTQSASVEAVCSATYPSSHATQRQGGAAEVHSSLCATVLAAQRALLSRTC